MTEYCTKCNKLTCAYCHTEINDKVLAGDMDGYLFHIECAKAFYVVYERTPLKPYVIIDSEGVIIE